MNTDEMQKKAARFTSSLPATHRQGWAGAHPKSSRETEWSPRNEWWRTDPLAESIRKEHPTILELAKTIWAREPKKKLRPARQKLRTFWSRVERARKAFGSWQFYPGAWGHDERTIAAAITSIEALLLSPTSPDRDR